MIILTYLFLNKTYEILKFVFSKKATKIDKIFTVNSTVKIFSILKAFLENIYRISLNNVLPWIVSPRFQKIGGH